MNMGYNVQAMELMTQIKETCKSAGGVFTLLWRTSYFANEMDKEFYSKTIK